MFVTRLSFSTPGMTKYSDAMPNPQIKITGCPIFSQRCTNHSLHSRYRVMLAIESNCYKHPYIYIYREVIKSSPQTEALPPPPDGDVLIRRRLSSHA